MLEQEHQAHRQVGDSWVADTVGCTKDYEHKSKCGDSFQAPSSSAGHVVGHLVGTSSRGNVGISVNTLDQRGSSYCTKHLRGNITQELQQADLVGEKEAQGHCWVQVATTAPKFALI